MNVTRGKIRGMDSGLQDVLVRGAKLGANARGAITTGFTLKSCGGGHGDKIPR